MKKKTRKQKNKIRQISYGNRTGAVCQKSKIVEKTVVLLSFPLVVGAYGNRTGAYGKAYGCVRESYGS